MKHNKISCSIVPTKVVFQIVDIITEFQTDRIAKPLERWCDLWQGGMSNLLGMRGVGGGDQDQLLRLIQDSCDS